MLVFYPQFTDDITDSKRLTDLPKVTFEEMYNKPSVFSALMYIGVNCGTLKKYTLQGSLGDFDLVAS